MTSKLLAAFTAIFFALPVLATEMRIELIMVEQEGCVYCEMWDEQIGPIYPKTAEGKAAPMRKMDIDLDYPPDLTFTAPLIFTPTFVLVQDGRELARIEGYPGEDFFWGLLARMLRNNIGFEGQS